MVVEERKDEEVSDIQQGRQEIEANLNNLGIKGRQGDNTERRRG